MITSHQLHTLIRDRLKDSSRYCSHYTQNPSRPSHEGAVIAMIKTITDDQVICQINICETVILFFSIV